MFNGTEHNKPLNTVQNLTFPSGNLLLKYTNGNTENFTLSEVRSVLFQGAPLHADFYVSEPVSDELLVYPNPTNSELNLGNIPQGTYFVRIYNLYGALLMQEQVNSESCTINVSHFKQGLYLIEFNNQIGKFFKL